MKLKLNKLSLRNFKGITEYELNTQGKSANIFGDNGTGKTTLYDSFLWLLFGKDSTDKSAFDWKPLDKKGNEINHLETEVVAELEVNSKAVKLSRMTKEKWTKKRGSAVEQFDGHTTEYRLDDLKVKKKEFDDYLSDLISEELFKLLTNVNYFPEVLKWQDRRETLINMVGDVTDLDVIANNNDLQPLKELIEERPADELKQLLTQQMRQINTDLKSIPNRIDEVDRGLPDISKLDKTKLKDKRLEKEDEISEVRNEIASLKNSDEVTIARNEIKDLQVHYRELELEHEVELSNEVAHEKQLEDEAETEVRAINHNINTYEQSLKNIEWELDKNNESLESRNKEREQLLEDFKTKQQEAIESFDEHQTTCPTCSQELPADQILELREKHEEKIKEFNKEKANRLREIQTDGKQVAENIEELTVKIKDLEKNKETLEEQISSERNELHATERDLEKARLLVKKVEERQSPFRKTEEAFEIQDQIKKLEEQIESGQSGVSETEQKLQDNINKLSVEIEEVNEKLQNIRFYHQQVKRKDELIKQEQDLSVKYGELEQQIHLLEEFTRTKVNLLTDTINDKFEHVRFKLFEEQINGGLKEVCEVTMDGANYSTGLNNAARINAGIDIIGTLMNHYEVYLPLWIDNSESVNELLDIDTQLITLSVSNHKNLRVEVV